jgi:hypothetical protein
MALSQALLLGIYSLLAIVFSILRLRNFKGMLIRENNIEPFFFFGFLIVLLFIFASLLETFFFTGGYVPWLDALTSPGGSDVGIFAGLSLIGISLVSASCSIFLFAQRHLSFKNMLAGNIVMWIVAYLFIFECYIPFDYRYGGGLNFADLSVVTSFIIASMIGIGVLLLGSIIVILVRKVRQKK